MLALFADDCVYNRPGYDPLCGKEELTRFYEGQRIIEKGEHRLTTLIVEDETAASAGRFAGISKSGEELKVAFAEVFRFTGDLIQERTTFFYRPAV